MTYYLQSIQYLGLSVHSNANHTQQRKIYYIIASKPKV